jgi:hypothetical protein
MEPSFLLLIAGVELINIALIMLGIYAMSKIHLHRIKMFASVVRDAFALRDARYRAIEAKVTRAVVLDTDFFDRALEDTTDLGYGENENERPKED